MNLKDITIEKGVALQENTFDTRKWKYEDTFRAIEVGDSFVVALPEGKTKQTLSTVRAVLCRYSKKLVHKYATRMVDNGTALRVWRTE